MWRILGSMFVGAVLGASGGCGAVDAQGTSPDASTTPTPTDGPIGSEERDHVVLVPLKNGSTPSFTYAIAFAIVHPNGELVDANTRLPLTGQGSDVAFRKDGLAAVVLNGLPEAQSLAFLNVAASATSIEADGTATLSQVFANEIAYTGANDVLVMAARPPGELLFPLVEENGSWIARANTPFGPGPLQLVDLNGAGRVLALRRDPAGTGSAIVPFSRRSDGVWEMGASAQSVLYPSDRIKSMAVSRDGTRAYVPRMNPATVGQPNPSGYIDTLKGDPATGSWRLETAETVQAAHLAGNDTGPNVKIALSREGDLLVYASLEKDPATGAFLRHKLITYAVTPTSLTKVGTESELTADFIQAMTFAPGGTLLIAQQAPDENSPLGKVVRSYRHNTGTNPAPGKWEVVTRLQFEGFPTAIGVGN